MSDSSAPATLLTADQAVQQIQNNILSNGQPHLWLTRYVQMNQVTLDGLIENDTFGNLSEFDEEHPAPTPLEQVKILRAFLKKKNQCEPHDVQAITAILKGFIERVKDQQRVVDNLLFQEQYAGRENWTITLLETIDVQFNALNTIQILNKMERMLDGIPQETQNKIELKNWVEQQRTYIANDPFEFHESNTFEKPEYRVDLPTFLVGAEQLSKFIRERIQFALNLYTSTRKRVLKISNFTPRQFFKIDLAYHLLCDAANFALDIFIFANLGMGLALSLCQELIYKIQKTLIYLGKKVLTEKYQWVTQEGILYLGKKVLPERYQWVTHILSFSAKFLLAFFMMLFGFRFLGQPPLAVALSLSWGLIGKCALGGLGFSIGELALGTTMAIGKFCQRTWNGIWHREAAQPAAALPVQLVPAPAANDIGIPLNPEQKKKLQHLLMGENMSVDGNQDMPADKKAKKKGKLGEEQTKLYDITAVYTLSKLDKKLLAKQANLPTGFENLEAEIRAVAPRASAG
jgi:hypothetical protein